VIPYADDLIVADKEEAKLQARFFDWPSALESKGFKIDIKKTETMVWVKTNEMLMIRDRTGHLLKQTETFKYLQSVMNTKSGCEQDVKNKIKATWQKWKDLAGVLCDAKMPKYLKGKVYTTMIRPVLMYGAEAWTVTRREEGLLKRTEMRMLRWIHGVSLKDMKRNQVIRKTLGVARITDKIPEARLRWYVM